MSEINFTITTDMNQAFQTIEKAEQDLIEVQKLAVETEKQVALVVKDSMSAIKSMAGMVKGIIYAIGDTIDPVVAASLDLVMASIQAILAVASAWASGGYTAIISAAMGVAALTLSIVSTIALATGQSDAKANIDKAGQVINSIMLGAKGFGRVF